MTGEYAEGVHLHRTDENVDEVEALASHLGGRVGVDAVLADLNRQGRRAWGACGRKVSWAFTWDREDRRTPRWWPQGISTSADASDTEEIGGRRVVVVTWYSKEVDGANHGSRVTFLDLDTLRYRHVLLVVPTLDEHGELTVAPLKVHAGGIVWCGPYLHVAATAKGFITCRVDDILRVPDDRASDDFTRLGATRDRMGSYGYRYVLPVRFSYQAFTDEGHDRMRYSFLSLDRGASPPELVAGEYGGRRQTTRLARYPLDPESMLLATDEDGHSRPLVLDPGGVVRMQGAAVVEGTYYVTASQGPVTPGSLYVGTPGRFRRVRWATPVGPEDIAYWPSTDMLWSVTEHPPRRWVYAMKRRRLG